jgi:DNA polymerase III epsilon subunit-like protein
MILLVDFETTGLLNGSQDFMRQPGICQIGAVKLERAEVEQEDETPASSSKQRATRARNDSFYTLCNPEISVWEEKAIKTHGITPEAVESAPTFFELGKALARFGVGCSVWAGFHTKFDREVLAWQLLRYGMEKSFPWPPEEYDVMKAAGRVMEQQGKRGVKRPSLSEAYQHFMGRSFEGAHDALSDIRATADVMRKVYA